MQNSSRLPHTHTAAHLQACEGGADAQVDLLQGGAGGREGYSSCLHTTCPQNATAASIAVPTWRASTALASCSLGSARLLMARATSA